MDFFIPAAHAQAAAAPEGGSIFDPAMLIMMGGLFLFMYLFMIRPQQKRQKEHRALVAEVKKGDEILLNSGLLGKITKVEDDYVVLKVADNTELKFQRIAIHAVLPSGTIKAI